MFAERWHKRKQHSFKCFYNEHDPKSVIQTKQHTLNDVIHSMLWPSLVIVICGVIFLRLEMRRRNLTFCGTNNNPSQPAQEQQHRNTQHNTGTGDSGVAGKHTRDACNANGTDALLCSPESQQKQERCSADVTVAMETVNECEEFKSGGKERSEER